MRRAVSSLSADVYLIFALAVLLLNFASQTLSFPFQVILVIYGVLKCDVRLLPGIYITLLDAAYFRFTGQPGILKFYLIVGVSVLNLFVIVVFLKTVFDILYHRFDVKTLVFVPFWVSMLIPAVYIAQLGKADGVASNWQTPYIYMMIPALYYWGIQLGKTWEIGKDHLVKRFLVIYIIQLVLESLAIYSPGCQFQNHIIPMAFGFAIISRNKMGVWKGIGLIGVFVALLAMLFGKYIENIEMYGLEGSAAAVSTFTRLFVVIIGGFVALTGGKLLRGHTLRTFPWVMLAICSAVFFYAVARAGTTNQSEVVGLSVADSKYTGILARFEMKLIGDRGSIWHDAVKNELFESPLVFKRQRDKEIYDPRLGRMITKMVPHNQFLTLVCRSGWWLGLGMMLFLWWMHLRSFRAASMIENDRFTLIALLAPSVGIFVAVGLTGQHVFTQMWHASSMAGLTFPGILYGAILSRREARCVC